MISKVKDIMYKIHLVYVVLTWQLGTQAGAQNKNRMVSCPCGQLDEYWCTFLETNGQVCLHAAIWRPFTVLKWFSCVILSKFSEVWWVVERFIGSMYGVSNTQKIKAKKCRKLWYFEVLSRPDRNLSFR